MDNAKPLLDVKHLSVALPFSGRFVNAIDNLSFQVNRGETLSFVGESGCGKSITALALNRLLPRSAVYSSDSDVLFEGHSLLEYSEASMRDIRGNRIAMIFQEPMTSLNPVMSVGDQIAEVFKQHTDLDRSAYQKEILALLESVGIPDPEHCYNTYPHQLSGGMRQRVVIAIALASKPDLLIADEPTTALDVTIQLQILSLLKKIQAETNMGIILITHDLGVVANMADNVIVMYAGKIIEKASAKQFFSAPKHPYSQQLFEVLPDFSKRETRLLAIPGQVPTLDKMPDGCRFADRCQFSWALCHKQTPDLRHVEDYQLAACHLYNADDPSRQERKPFESKKRLYSNNPSLGKTILSIQSMKVFFPILKGLLRKKVADLKAVDGISLTLEAGRTTALVGESGSGKSTLGKAILALLESTEGQVFYEDMDLLDTSKSAMRALRQDFQIIFQDPFSSLNPRMTVFNLIAEGLFSQKLVSSSKEAKKEVENLLKAVGLSPESVNRYPHEFSGGQRQRICIARALAVKPKIIVCDELTSALDLSVQAQILNLLKKLQLSHNVTYLFITHDISVVSYMADEVAVMYLGRIVEKGNVASILKTPKHPYTQALLSAVPSLSIEENKKVFPLLGEQPSPINPPTGCHFHPRCPHALARCRQEYPEAIDDGDQWVKCFLYD